MRKIMSTKSTEMKKMLVLCAASSAMLFGACCGPTERKEAAAEERRTELEHGAEITLARPAAKGGLTVVEALRKRRSSREFAPEALSAEEVSGVLWAAGGINRPENDHLTAPSAMGLYPIRIHAIFAEGAYRYDARENKLVRVAEGDVRKLAGTQPFVCTAPLNLVYVADLSVYEGRAIPAEHVRYLCGQDAAGYAENVNLYAAGHDLQAITRGSVPEAELLAALGLDPARYFVALAQSVGR